MARDLILIILGGAVCTTFYFWKELTISFWSWRLRVHKRALNKMIRKLEGYE
jgi:hypothetical protein